MLMKLEFSQQIFEIFSKIKFNVNMSSRSRVVPCGWTEMDRHDKSNSQFMQFCEYVKKLTVVTNHSSSSQQNSSLHNSNRSNNNNDSFGNI
jgi:hypothetical protein